MFCYPIFFTLYYIITEECREQDSCTYHEKAGTNQHHDGFGYVTFARIHLYIDSQSSYDGYDGSYGIHQIDYIEHVIYYPHKSLIHSL